MTSSHGPASHDQHAPSLKPLNIDLTWQNPAAATIRLGGELDVATAPILGSCLDSLVNAGSGCASVTVDLSAATFVSVAGVNLLLVARGRAERAGTAFCVVGCSRHVRRILHITETARLLVPSVPGSSAADTSDATVDDARTAHTDLPSENSVTPRRVERAETTCSPRPRRVRWSRGRGRGAGHGR